MKMHTSKKWLDLIISGPSDDFIADIQSSAHLRDSLFDAADEIVASYFGVSLAPKCEFSAYSSLSWFRNIKKGAQLQSSIITFTYLNKFISEDKTIYLDNMIEELRRVSMYEADHFSSIPKNAVEYLANYPVRKCLRNYYDFLRRIIAIKGAQSDDDLRQVISNIDISILLDQHIVDNQFLVARMREYNFKLRKKEYVTELSREELIQHIKAFTIVDRLDTCGSVSCVGYLMQEYKYRVMPSTTAFNESQSEENAAYDAILDWVLMLNNGRNPYLPETYALRGITNINQYKQYKDAVAAYKSSRKPDDSIERHQKKKERLKIKANKNIWNAIRRRDKEAIKAMIEHGVDLDQTNDEGKTVKELLLEVDLFN
jgi:hypothetical protein